MNKIFTEPENSFSADQHASNIVYLVKVFLLSAIAILLLVLKGSCTDSTHIKAKNTFYLQVAGAGNRHSVNYDNVFRQGRNMNYSFSAGLSTAAKAYALPLTINAFTTGKQHHFEMSLAVIPYVEKHFYSKSTDLDKQLYIKPSIGYRYQKLSSGYFLKAGVGPQLFMDPPSSSFWAFTPKLIAPSAQLAMGISF